MLSVLFESRSRFCRKVWINTRQKAIYRVNRSAVETSLLWQVAKHCSDNGVASPQPYKDSHSRSITLISIHNCVHRFKIVREFDKRKRRTKTAYASSCHMKSTTVITACSEVGLQSSSLAPIQTVRVCQS